MVSEASAKAFWQASLATAPAPVIHVSMPRYVRLFHTMTVVVRGRGEVAGTGGPSATCCTTLIPE